MTIMTLLMFITYHDGSEIIGEQSYLQMKQMCLLLNGRDELPEVQRSPTVTVSQSCVVCSVAISFTCLIINYSTILCLWMFLLNFSVVNIVRVITCWIGWYLWASHQLNEPLILNIYPKLL